MSELVQSKLKFKNPIIENVHFQRNLDYDDMKEVVGFVPSAEMNVKMLEGSMAIATLTFSIGEKATNPYFTFSAVASADFKWENMEDEAARKQLRISGASVLISYIRPVLSSMTAQSGLLPYQLPFIDFSRFE